MATKGCELSEWKHVPLIEALAAAYAEVGDWQHAVQRQEQAIQMSGHSDPDAAAAQRLELYKQKKAYRLTDIDGSDEPPVPGR